MPNMQAAESTRLKPLRLWPAVVAVALQWLLWSVLPIVAPGALLYSVFGAVLCGLAVIAWWLFFSRAPWAERLGALVLMRSPYGRRGPIGLVARALAHEGFQVVIQSCRGTAGSGARQRRLKRGTYAP